MALEDHLESPLARAVRVTVGRQSGFARLIGRSQPYVHKLLQDGKRLPGEYVLTVEAATGVSKHDLRPDLYPREGAAPTGQDRPSDLVRAQ
ncbi:Putative antitoxin of toxin-antitoxin system, YdaS/YdaT [Sphingomonas gellani]|uniref:Putative antitoxin of toxin-antitoxin system, YdaS/YdaT n=1 Tax=Sphingomonas gellani TaxID=1166340 RepID=A0A1H8AQP3_9SPHN|nr:YdaS family helix-turn-helix protein [Sphingomonas gellani]SEM73042.1 Putative antitoxin of toxin-antitoxin system, YdaS/YdaT [Sphingomonas gellani]